MASLRRLRRRCDSNGKGGEEPATAPENGPVRSTANSVQGGAQRATRRRYETSSYSGVMSRVSQLFIQVPLVSGVTASASTSAPNRVPVPVGLSCTYMSCCCCSATKFWNRESDMATGCSLRFDAAAGAADKLIANATSQPPTVLPRYQRPCRSCPTNRHPFVRSSVRPSG